MEIISYGIATINLIIGTNGVILMKGTPKVPLPVIVTAGETIFSFLQNPYNPSFSTPFEYIGIG